MDSISALIINGTLSCVCTSLKVRVAETWYNEQNEQNDGSLNWLIQYWNEQLTVELETVDTNAPFNTEENTLGIMSDDFMNFDNLSTIALFGEDSVTEG